NLFQPAPQNYRPRMENIEDIQIQQVQPSTLNNIRRFVTEWNQDPVSQTIEELLVPCDNILLFEDIEILAHVTENPNQIDHSVDSEKDYFHQIRNDLLARSNTNEIATLLNHEGHG
ncbi:10415_t:CDS:2, partial [Gigaspora margarita]